MQKISHKYTYIPKRINLHQLIFFWWEHAHETLSKAHVSTKFTKFTIIIFIHDLNGISVNVGDSQIVPSVKVRNLGVIFDQSLTFDDHISAIYQSVHFHIRNIGKVRKLLSFDACATLIHALISSCLDYCNSILYNLPDTRIGRLQRVQNQVARILTRYG